MPEIVAEKTTVTAGLERGSSLLACLLALLLCLLERGPFSDDESVVPNLESLHKGESARRRRRTAVAKPPGVTRAEFTAVSLTLGGGAPVHNEKRGAGITHMSGREYLAANGVQEALAAALLEVLQTRPAQPLLAICKFLASKEAAQEGQAAAAAAVSHAERFLQLFQPKPSPRPRARAAIVDAVTEATLDALFDAIDTDHSGTLDANELLAILLKMGFSGLDDEACNALIREVDLNGDSLVQREEFAALVTPTAPLDGAQPHLVLHFDVNMTVIMLDSAIGGDSAKILNMVLSNCVWGKVTPAEPEPTWELVSKIPSPTAPEIGLQTYAEYVMSVTDVKGMSDVTKIRETKARRRKALQSFTSAGAPGAALAALLRSMADALKLPKQLISDEQADVLKRLGLDGGVCVLLPSFLHLLRELKKTGRSFSICFRTFGTDLPKIAAEYVPHPAPRSVLPTPCAAHALCCPRPVLRMPCAAHALCCATL